jgi:hypothetical protein
MFECYTRERRFRYYEAGNGFYLERMCDGKTVGIGDGVDMFCDEEGEPSPVGTEEFYQRLRLSVLDQSEPLLNLAHFGK